MEIEELLQKYSPTEIENMFESACPMFEPSPKNFSGVYLAVHEIANNFIAIDLKEKLSNLEIAAEEDISGTRCRVDIRVSTKNGKLDIVGMRRKIAVIEVKSGKLKLIQPAIYAYKEKIDVLLVGIQSREMQIVTLDLGEALIHRVADHIGKKERLKQKDSPILDNCKKCSASCGYAGGEELNLNERDDVYEKKIKLLLNGNLDFVTKKIVEYIKKQPHCHQI